MLHLRTLGRQIAAKDCYGAIVPNGILEASDDVGAFPSDLRQVFITFLIVTVFL